MLFDLLSTDAYIATAFVHQGLIPCLPAKPSVAITIRTLELYRIVHLCSPHLAVQPFVNGLCDLHGVRVVFAVPLL